LSYIESAVSVFSGLGLCVRSASF